MVLPVDLMMGGMVKGLPYGRDPQAGLLPRPQAPSLLILILGVRDVTHTIMKFLCCSVSGDKIPQVKQLDGFANYRTSFHDSARSQEVEQNVWIPKRTSCPTPPRPFRTRDGQGGLGARHFLPEQLS